ncbi:PREDICTED: reverse mRNAase [Prunus dulcis]|uniref:PREDICTED: reverse mRNAase n=1 Tax=Prunus dulcis TaxID=3755 RepID=A0A5E4GKK7_PRUDU|nr:PREDICTED: reverse mRNAase [Prunus dulcis]
MDKDSRQWNFQNVCMVLDRETMDAIRSIPIGNVRNPDRIVWPWSANGQYSVKSGYHIIHALCSELSGITWRKDTNRASLGVMIRDSEGLLCDGSAENMIWHSVLVAKAEAALGGLKLAFLSNYRKVTMEIDSLVLKAGVDGKHENHTWEILPILLEIRRVEAMFDAVEWSWIPCKKNRVAHAVT